MKMTIAQSKETEIEVRKALFRDAVAKAADFIEKNPERFEFYRTQVPASKEHENACAIGWIGYFAGMAPGTFVCDVTHHFGTSDWEIYMKLNEHYTLWNHNHILCASALRAAFL
jgi:hypothetical protein